MFDDRPMPMNEYNDEQRILDLPIFEAFHEIINSHGCIADHRFCSTLVSDLVKYVKLSGERKQNART